MLFCLNPCLALHCSGRFFCKDTLLLDMLLSYSQKYNQKKRFVVPFQFCLPSNSYDNKGAGNDSRPLRLCCDKVLLEFCDVCAELRLQVCSLVLVDVVCLSELVQHLLNSGVHSLSFSLISGCAELTNCVTHGLSIVSVAQSSGFSLSDSLQR